VTNHICQNVASLPFLWILPLGLYLGTFILCFDHPRWYRRNVFLALAAIALPWMGWYSDSLDLKLVVPMYLAGLFVCCMFCHGELALLKPAPRYLTTYYLMISLGGAIGGLLVGLAAPYLLTGYFELAIGLVACALLLLYRTVRIAWWAVLASVAVVGATGWGAGKAVEYQIATSRVMLRNFYSVVRTREDTTPVPFRSMVHGGIVHGGQLLDPELRLHPSSYFGPTSGYGRLFASLPDAPRKVGVIGLGAGSIIAHARAGDTFRFYEINPQVLELARREFTFLTDSPATVDVVLGDGRLSLEREPSHQFDVLVMDAFSGDSIPMHLLTREAMAIYLRHLKPGGVLAFQATNRFIDIAPVVASLAAERGLTAVLISDAPQSTEGEDYWLSSTDQILVTSDRALLGSDPIGSVGKALESPPGFRIWTDDFNNLWRVLK
jgi:SAM-dependent methyltransferase